MSALFRLFILLALVSPFFGKSVSDVWLNLSRDEINEFPPLRDPMRSNYSVTFVPLISVIANYLPRFLNKLRTQVTSARSMNWLLTDERICTPHHLGRFPNPDNHCQFFECAMNIKNFVNCSQPDRSEENVADYGYVKPIDNMIQLKSTVDLNTSGRTTSLAVMYKVDECVSLILHQCSPDHSYSNRLQRCISHNGIECPD